MTSARIEQTKLVVLKAKPESLKLDLDKSSLVIVDMQNAFVSPGGMWHLRGIGLSKAGRIIDHIRQLSLLARERKVRIIYVITKFPREWRESRGPEFPIWYKGALSTYREHPEWENSLLSDGTWGAEVVDELRPQKGDIIVEKIRYSVFYESKFEAVLKRFHAKYLFFVGVATNVCVEACIRDAYYRDYFSVLISDATGSTGPSFMQEATIFNVERYYGWVTRTDDVIAALQ